MIPIDGNMSKKLWSVVFVIVVAMVACTTEEPFDVLEAQRQLSGKWQCQETSVVENGTKKNPVGYQMTISANGVMSIDMSNFAGLNVIIKADLLDENNILIPTQTKDGFTIEGEGTISNKYKKMNLSYSYTDTGRRRTEVLAACDKK